MTILNSVSAVFDVVKASRRVRAAMRQPLMKLHGELQLLDKTLATLDRVEGNLGYAGAPIGVVKKAASKGSRKRAKRVSKAPASAKKVPNPNRVAGGKRAAAKRYAAKAGKPAKPATPADATDATNASVVELPAQTETAKAARGTKRKRKTNTHK